MKKEVLSQINLQQEGAFATCSEGRPYVRPVMIIYFNEQFYVATGAEDNKIKQLKDNAFFEFYLTFRKSEGTGYMRARGKAELSDSRQEKADVFRAVEFIKHFYDTPEHPGFALIRLNVAEIEYIRAGEENIHLIKMDDNG